MFGCAEAVAKVLVSPSERRAARMLVLDAEYAERGIRAQRRGKGAENPRSEVRKGRGKARNKPAGKTRRADVGAARGIRGNADSARKCADCARILGVRC